MPFLPKIKSVLGFLARREIYYVIIGAILFAVGGFLLSLFNALFIDKLGIIDAQLWSRVAVPESAALRAGIVVIIALVILRFTGWIFIRAKLDHALLRLPVIRGVTQTLSGAKKFLDGTPALCIEPTYHQFGAKHIILQEYDGEDERLCAVAAIHVFPATSIRVLMNVPRRYFVTHEKFTRRVFWMWVLGGPTAIGEEDIPLLQDLDKAAKRQMSQDD